MNTPDVPTRTTGTRKKNGIAKPAPASKSGMVPLLMETMQPAASRQVKSPFIMNEELKIDRKSWMSKEDDGLDTMSTAIAGALLTNPAYKDVEVEAKALDESGKSFHRKLSDFKNFGGNTNKTAKNYARIDLESRHETVALKLEATAQGNKEYIEILGYTLSEQDKEGVRSTATVKPPVKKKAGIGSARGEVKFILGAEYPREIKGIAGERTTDGAKTWQNGIFATKLNFELSGEPSGMLVGYRFYFLATNNRQSKFSETIWMDVY